MPLNYEAPTNSQKEGRPGLLELASNYKAEKLGALKKPDPMDPAPLLALFDKFNEQIDRMEKQVADHEVTDDESSAKAAAFATESRKLHNAIEKKRKEVTAPYNGVVKEINTGCKPLTNRLLSLQRSSESKNRDYLIEKKRQKEEAERKAAEEAQRIQQEAERKRREIEEAQRKAEAEAAANNEPPPPPPEIEPEPVVVVPAPVDDTKIQTDTGTQDIEYNHVPVLVDIRQIPDACITARMKQIEAAVLPWARAQVKAGIRDILGFRVEKQAKVKTRAGR